MTAVLVTSMFLPFCFVVAFILYICFWDRWRQYRTASRKTEDIQPLSKTHLSHNFVELVNIDLLNITELQNFRLHYFFRIMKL